MAYQNKYNANKYLIKAIHYYGQLLLTLENTIFNHIIPIFN